MTSRTANSVLNDLQISSRRIGRHALALCFCGAVDYYTAEHLSNAYRSLVTEQGRGLNHLVLDLRPVNRFDTAGVAALLEVVRDAETRHFRFTIADRPERPTYVATGLHERLRFLSAAEIEDLGL